MSGVDPAYRHIPKRASPQPSIGGLKSYLLFAPDSPIDAAIVAAARAVVAAGAWRDSSVQDDEPGFVILHRCGADFFFLLISIWRGSNEVWEAVWYRDGSMSDFAPFSPAYPDAVGAPRPTFCVWELGIVAHEALAWAALLQSERTDNDVNRWRVSVIDGQV